MESYYENLFLAALFVLAVLTVLCLVRAVKGPTVADRLIAVNMIGTMTIGMIVVLAGYMHETYLLDIAQIYTLMSFLAVVVLAKIYLGIQRRKHFRRRHDKENGGGEA